MGMNPTDKSCFVTCPVCFKCADKNVSSYGNKCSGCTGRHDPQDRLYVDTRVFCDCKNGTMRHMTQEGRLIVRDFPGNPYGNKVVQDLESQDERDWKEYLQTMREYYNDPYWDPIKFSDGASTTDWTQDNREGRGY